MNKSLYDFEANKIDGKKLSMAEYKGKVVLIVNVASKCGLTPQYEALEKLYEQYNKRGFEILGFPANEFEGQEPGNNLEIQEFCRMNYGIKFPMFEKIAVKGTGQHPLFQFLTEQKPVAELPEGPSFEEKLKGYGIVRENKTELLWNFEKFLVDREGKIVNRFNPDMTPDNPKIKLAIESIL